MDVAVWLVRDTPRRNQPGGSHGGSVQFYDRLFHLKLTSLEDVATMLVVTADVRLEAVNVGQRDDEEGDLWQ